MDFIIWLILLFVIFAVAGWGWRFTSTRPPLAVLFTGRAARGVTIRV